jgi:hypothetical protein
MPRWASSIVSPRDLRRSAFRAGLLGVSADLGEFLL